MYTRSFRLDAKYILHRRLLRCVAAYIVLTMISWTLPVTVYAEGIRVTTEFTRNEAALASTNFKMQKALLRLEYKVATTKTVDFAQASRSPIRPSAPKPSLLDEVGRFSHAVSVQDLAAWKSELHALPTAPNGSPVAERAAQLHIWIGEYALAHNQQPHEAYLQFKTAGSETGVRESLHGLAAYDCALAVYFTHNFVASVNAFNHVLRVRPHLIGFNRTDALLMLRHAAACAGYHAEHARLGIPEPPQLDPLCGAASLAASLESLGLPYDKTTLLKECRVTGEGSGLVDLVNAGTKAGVSVRPITATDHALLSLPKPLVAFVEHDHFVSVVRADKHGVSYLCSDCGPWPGGRITLTWKQWNAMAPGVYAAVVRPGYSWDRFFDTLKGSQRSTSTASSQPSIKIAGLGGLASLIVSKSVLGVSILADITWGFVICGIGPYSTHCCAFCPLYVPGPPSPPAASPGAGTSTPPALPNSNLPAAATSTLPTSPSAASMSAGASAGDPVNLATGEEEYKPAADLTVYNPHGPSVTWQRIYNSLRPADYQSSYYEPFDFGAGWSHTYNIGVQDPSNGGTGTSNPKYFFEPNGARIMFTAPAGSAPTASTPVQCAVEPGRSFSIEWDYHAAVGSTPAYTNYVITNSDRTKIVTTAINPNTLCCQLAQIIDRNANAINFNYSQFSIPISTSYPLDLPSATSWPLLTSITDAASVPLLTINRAQDGSGNITSVDDRYGRSVYYHVGYHGYEHLGSYLGNQQVDRVSQIVTTGSVAPNRYTYTYQQITIPENSSSDSYLHTISVPNPNTTLLTPSVATINYNSTAASGYQNTVASITDANGNTAAFTPINPDGTVNNASNLTEVQVTGGSGSYTYRAGFDNNMNETNRTDGNNVNVSQTQYDGTNPYSPYMKTNGNGNVWSYTYDNSHGDFGNIATIVSPRGVTSTWTWSYSNFALGELMSKQDSYVSGGTTIKKAATTFTWDESHGGLVQSITKPAPGTIGSTQSVKITYSYNQYGDITQIVAPGNGTVSTITITLGYGSMPAIKQPLTITDNISHSLTCTYDAQGNYTSMTYLAQTGSGGNEVDFGTATLPGYNIANQRLLVLYPATGESGTGRASMTMGYQYPGGPQTFVRHYDEGNNSGPVREIDYTYGQEGEQLSVSGGTEPAKYTYDMLYRLASLMDGDGHVTSYFYNTQGYLKQVALPGASATPPTSPLAAGSADTMTYTSYDAIGDALTRVDGRDVTTTYTYNADPESKLTTIHYVLPASPPATLTALADVNITYDPYGRTSTVTNGVTTTNYGYTSGTTYPGYDDRDETLNIQTSYLAANGTTVLFSKAIGYSYNADGSRAGMTTPAGSFTYAYDGDARPTGVTNPFGETASWSYYQNNWLNTQTLKNSASTTVATATSTYDTRGFLTSLVNSAGGGGELSNFSSLVHDSVGNLGSISAVVDSEPATYSGSTTYTYDSADELKQEASLRNGTYTNNFSYDAAQNPTTSRSVSGNTYDSDNQSTNTGYAFDGSGNPTTYGGATLAFDGENRLTKYGTSTMSATYDATNLRASKTNSAGTIYYLYDNTLPVCELSSTGTIASTNTFGEQGLLSRHTGSTSTFYTFDAQGNVSERLSSSGSVQTASTFDAFGLATTTGTVSDPFGYCAKWGYYTDTETGLQLATYRYYDPRAGRFLTRDPLSYAGGINLYNYTHNNAVNLQDPRGTDACDDACDAAFVFECILVVICTAACAALVAILVARGMSLAGAERIGYLCAGGCAIMLGWSSYQLSACYDCCSLTGHPCFF